MQQLRVRLWSMMGAVAVIALAVVVQSVRLRQALIREQQLRVEAAFERAQATLARISAQAAEQPLTAPAALRP